MDIMKGKKGKIKTPERKKLGLYQNKRNTGIQYTYSETM